MVHAGGSLSSISAPLLRNFTSLLRNSGTVSSQSVPAYHFHHPSLLPLLEQDCVRGAVGIQASDTTQTAENHANQNSAVQATSRTLCTIWAWYRVE